MNRVGKAAPVMMQQIDVDALLEDFCTPTHRAVTLSRRIVVSPCVVDAQIVHTTVEAAQFYGFARPEDMIGYWQSYLQHTDDVSLSRAMAVRRHFGYDQIPNDYVIRVRQGTTNRFRRAKKHTTQLELAGETHWVTVLEETPAPLLAETFDIVKHFPLRDSDAVRQYSGLMSVVEMVGRLQRVYVPTAHPTMDLTSSGLPSMMSAMQTSPAAPPPHLGGMASATLTLSPGETAGLGDGTFIHRCGKCRVVWTSAQADPVKCPRQRADARGAKCGIRRWRYADPSAVPSGSGSGLVFDVRGACRGPLEFAQQLS